MGKQKRARQKFHLASVRGRFAERQEETQETPENGSSTSLGDLTWRIPAVDNIFQGININVEDIKKSLTEDDVASVRSLAKSIRQTMAGKRLKKEEKRKLRHNLFIKTAVLRECMKFFSEIDMLYREMRTKRNFREIVQNLRTAGEASGSAQQQIEPANTTVDPPAGDLSGASTSVPNSGRVKRERKRKPILKAKARSRAMVRDVAAMKKAMKRKSGGAAASTAVPSASSPRDPITTIAMISASIASRILANSL